MKPRLTIALIVGWAAYDVAVGIRNLRREPELDPEFQELVRKHNFLADLVNRNQHEMEITDFDRIVINDLYDM